jgi:hypothetical protein
MFNKFLKNKTAFFALMLAPLFQTRFYAIADDKLAAPGNIENRSSTILAEIGRQATNAIQCLLGVFTLNWNDSICNRKAVPIIYLRNSPVGDADLGALSIGSWALVYTITSKEISGHSFWYKTAAGANGWEKVNSSLDSKSLTVQTAITDAGAVTHTAANVVNGFIPRDPNGAGRTDVTPTAAQLLAQARTVFGNIAVGSNFVFEIANTADGNETITLGAGSGVTLWPASQTVVQNANGRFRAVFTNVTASSEAVTIYKV